MAAPTKKEVIKMLKRSKRYIYEQHMTRFALKAYGEKSLKKIEILDSHVDKVGNYDTNMRYWPVFAVFKVRYTTVDDKKVMGKFIMKYRIYRDSSGGYHLSNSAEVLSAKEM